MMLVDPVRLKIRMDASLSPGSDRAMADCAASGAVSASEARAGSQNFMLELVRQPGGLLQERHLLRLAGPEQGAEIGIAGIPRQRGARLRDGAVNDGEI